jgi:hypothetical protein
MISNILKFETDNSKFYDDQDEIITSMGNSIPFNNKKNSKPNLEIDIANEFSDSYDCFDSFANLDIKTTFFQFEYYEKIIKFKNREELAVFVNDNIEYDEPYYVFNIPKKTHCIQIKMRNIESVCDYLLKFYQK